jgi:hypothetical protein
MILHPRRDSRQNFDENSLACLLIAKTEELRLRVKEIAGAMNERMRLLVENEVRQDEESVG